MLLAGVMVCDAVDISLPATAGNLLIKFSNVELKNENGNMLSNILSRDPVDGLALSCAAGPKLVSSGADGPGIDATTSSCVDVNSQPAANVNASVADAAAVTSNVCFASGGFRRLVDFAVPLTLFLLLADLLF